MIKLSRILRESLFSEESLKPATQIPPALYHATFEELVSSIAKHGLVPAGNNPNFQETDKNYVYLADSARTANHIIADLYKHSPTHFKKFGGKINVLQINIKLLNPSLLFEDPWSAAFGGKAFMYKGKIPSKAIVDYGD